MTDSPIPTISHHPEYPPDQILRAMADAAEGRGPDRYGDGGAVALLEDRVVELLGLEAAVIMPSGTMAQQIALRIWCERAGVNRVAFHPLAHLELHEEMGYRHLHGLDSVRLGRPDRLMEVEDLDAVLDPLAALLIELPQREIGGALPAWADLVSLVERARARGLAVHMDGARLWETTPFYQRTSAEIAGLFDSVYVSFYKILGGVSGATLAGSRDFIDRARIWRRRHGGTLVHLWPIAISAGAGLDRHLAHIHDYHRRAVEVAGLLSAHSGVRITPDPPHTNMMHVFIAGDHDRLVERHTSVSERLGRALFRSLLPTGVPDWWSFEITGGEVALDVDDQVITDLIAHTVGEVAGPSS